MAVLSLCRYLLKEELRVQDCEEGKNKEEDQVMDRVLQIQLFRFGKKKISDNGLRSSTHLKNRAELRL